MQLGCPPVRWKGPALALFGAAAVAGIAIGFTRGGGSDTTITRASTEPATSNATTGAGTTSPTTSTSLIQLPKPGHIRLGHRLLVATVDDAVRQSDPKLADDLMKVSADAGFDAVLVSSMWEPGAQAPSAQERLTLGNVVRAADAEGMQVF